MTHALYSMRGATHGIIDCLYGAMTHSFYLGLYLSISEVIGPKLECIGLYRFSCPETNCVDNDQVLLICL